MPETLLSRLARACRDAAKAYLDSERRRSRSRVTPTVPGSTQSDRRPAGAPASAASYPGDFTGRVQPLYDPHPDGEPDPGEIVWTWVPYEEDHRQGKDRPVLLVGRDGRWLLGLQLTSQDHDRDAARERAAGRIWLDIGSGAWDPQRRPSEVRVNRVIRVDPDGIRREGAVLREEIFLQVATALRDPA